MMRKRVFVGALCALVAAALALAFTSGSASAQSPPCDASTAGGFIVQSGKATFGAAGGCKDGSFFGHLTYQDSAAGLTVHWISITGYKVADVLGFFPDANARLICGTASTNLFGNVDFVARVKDMGEPGINDEFDVRLTVNGGEVYTTFAGGPHKLGGGVRGGGNDQLHKPNTSTAPVVSCPALPPPPPPEGPDVSVTKAAPNPDVSTPTPAVYIITVTAGGTGDSTNVTLNDTLPARPAGFPWTMSGDTGSCTLTPLPDDGGTQTLTCTFGTMASGSSKSITVSSATSASDCTNPPLSNEATVTADVDANTSNNTSGPVLITVSCPPPE